jgi:hypothetical protein
MPSKKKKRGGKKGNKEKRGRGTGKPGNILG